MVFPAVKELRCSCITPEVGVSMKLGFDITLSKHAIRSEPRNTSTARSSRQISLFLHISFPCVQGKPSDLTVHEGYLKNTASLLRRSSKSICPHSDETQISSGSPKVGRVRTRLLVGCVQPIMQTVLVAFWGSPNWPCVTCNGCFALARGWLPTPGPRPGTE